MKKHSEKEYREWLNKYPLLKGIENLNHSLMFWQIVALIEAIYILIKS